MAEGLLVAPLPWYRGLIQHGADGAVSPTLLTLPVRALLWRRHGVVGRERQPERRAAIPEDRPDLRFRDAEGSTGDPEEEQRHTEEQEQRHSA